MMRAIDRHLVAIEVVGVPVAIDPFVVVPNDLGDFCVVVDLRKNPLPNLRMSLHHSAFVECEGPRLFEEPGRKPDLSDVVDESSHMRPSADLIR